jgi:hypothetical protein
VVILVHLFREPPRPVHPGVVVGLDLVLWLFLSATALLTVGAASSLNRFGRDPNFLPDPSYGGYSYYSGGYYLAPNDTWVFNVTSVRSNVIRDCTPRFATCAEQDAFVNTLWRAKPQRFALDVTVATAQIIVLLLHFALFVWGCVDTNRRNRSKRGDNAHFLAQAMVQDMQHRGMITVHGGGPVVYAPVVYGEAVRGQVPYGPPAHGPTQWHPAPVPATPPIKTERWA